MNDCDGMVGDRNRAVEDFCFVGDAYAFLGYGTIWYDMAVGSSEICVCGSWSPFFDFCVSRMQDRRHGAMVIRCPSSIHLRC